MSFRSIVILAVVVLVAVIAVFEWFLCIALSRNESMRKRNSSDDDGEQEAFLKELTEEGKAEDSLREASSDTINVSTPKRRKKRFIQHWQLISLFLAAYDIFAVNLAFFLALWLRFDCRYSAIPSYYFGAFLHFSLIYTPVCIAVFWALRLYKSIWRFAGLSEFLRSVSATVITGAFHIVGITLMYRRMPISYYIIGILIQFFLVLGIRFAYRFVLLIYSHMRKNGEVGFARVMLVGAGAAGRMIMRDISNAREITDRVMCIIDDNPNKWGRFVEGVPVEGGREDILLNVQKYRIDKIYVAIPTATAEQKRDILNICKETGCELKILPGIYQLVNDEVSVKTMKEVAIEDLLGREPIRIDMDEVYQFLSGKVVLVTGGGGSIGSELCRQIASHGPKQLIIFDVYENNAYDIQLELKDKYPELNLVVLIGSVRDSRRLDQVFGKYHPEIVYHAAAHKHVPLMEDSPCEAIKNNTIGTYKTAYAAMMHGCRRFVLISTDKAVNPTNIMGASKRLCEMLIQTFDRKIREGKVEDLPVLYTHASEEKNGRIDVVHTVRKRGNPAAAVYTGGRKALLADEDGFPGYSDSIQAMREAAAAKEAGADVPGRASVHAADLQKPCTEFVAVRFGNVLGSNGSVVPLFKRQIAKGGPVTVTHPDIIRYFMTIPEAVSLVLQAGTYAHGGEIFVLDMGCPVKIDTLARNLIKLSGYQPDVDIKVEYTGLRPGEKLYEEKLMAEEALKKSPNKWIHVGAPLKFDTDLFLAQLEELMETAYGNQEGIRNKVAEIVGTYHLEKAGNDRN